MDCWIGVVQEMNRQVVCVAGRLTGEQVPELLGACATGCPLALDLSDLVSVDQPGIEALQRLRRRGATLMATPGYIRMKLDAPSL